MSKYEIDEQEWRKSELKIMREEVRKEVKEEVRFEVKEELRMELSDFHLMEQIQKKLAKGRTPERIAEELEEPLSEVMRIIGTRV